MVVSTTVGLSVGENYLEISMREPYLKLVLMKILEINVNETSSLQYRYNIPPDPSSAPKQETIITPPGAARLRGATIIDASRGGQVFPICARQSV